MTGPNRGNFTSPRTLNRYATTGDHRRADTKPSQRSARPPCDAMPNSAAVTATAEMSWKAAGSDSISVSSASRPSQTSARTAPGSTRESGTLAA
ncbi:oxidoreductase [Leifsonia xyli subsp. cynodontis DSM 46306]|uniref:Uncharacterized protein n=1 Tax=Leifsonia xyli subsp. cynodontis DSM 46306 TaxID=1389489 RepID=U3P7Q4_LEIXC|nr:oxidoreductase [Leifsonia xyli subsp. cynodontis DSM 46306]